MYCWRGQVYDIYSLSFPLSSLLVLVPTSFAGHISPRGYLSHFLHIPLELFTYFG